MRKEPRQARSRAMVEAVVEAGTRILGKEGWTALNTNKIADVAGVSVGSLYQYFPDKLSLVDAIRRRHLDDCIARVRELETDGRSAADFARELVSTVIAAHSVHPTLHPVLLDEAPTTERFRDPTSAFEIEYLSHFSRVVAAYRQGSAAEIETMGQILSDAIDGIIHNAARRGALGSEAVRGELTRLVRRYLEE